MSKLVLWLSLIGISILLIGGLVAPDNPIMWMASTSENFALIRALLIVILIGLLITNPPRNVYFRAFVGAISAIVAGWVLSATYQNQMALLDTMALLQVCIAAGLTVLERDIETQPVVLHHSHL